MFLETQSYTRVHDPTQLVTDLGASRFFVHRNITSLEKALPPYLWLEAFFMIAVSVLPVKCVQQGRVSRQLAFMCTNMDTLWLMLHPSTRLSYRYKTDKYEKRSGSLVFISVRTERRCIIDCRSSVKWHEDHRFYDQLDFNGSHCRRKRLVVIGRRVWRRAKQRVNK